MEYPAAPRTRLITCFTRISSPSRRAFLNTVSRRAPLPSIKTESERISLDNIRAIARPFFRGDGVGACQQMEKIGPAILPANCQHCVRALNQNSQYFQVTFLSRICLGCLNFLVDFDPAIGVGQRAVAVSSSNKLINRSPASRSAFVVSRNA